jgi:hypothetical protein
MVAIHSNRLYDAWPTLGLKAKQELGLLKQ